MCTFSQYQAIINYDCNNLKALSCILYILSYEVISKVFVDFKFFLSDGLPDSPMKPF